MFRLLPCLLVCLILAPSQAPPHQQPGAPTEAGGDDPIFISVSDDGSPLPDDEAMQVLAEQNPIVFFENCLRRCGRQVKDFQALLSKRERIQGKLFAPELVRVWFREQPLSVILKWVEGSRLASSVLYVAGENDGKLLVRPAGFLGRLVSTVQRDPFGEDARQNGRYPLPEFGIRVGMERTLASWVCAQKHGCLHIEYLGLKPIPELNNRVCYILHRTGYDKPEHDGVTDLVAYIDQETWLHTGSVLRDAKGELIAAYFFRDVQINPSFPANLFTRQGMP